MSTKFKLNVNKGNIRKVGFYIVLLSYISSFLLVLTMIINSEVLAKIYIFMYGIFLFMVGNSILTLIIFDKLFGDIGFEN